MPCSWRAAAPRLPAPAAAAASPAARVQRWSPRCSAVAGWQRRKHSIAPAAQQQLSNCAHSTNICPQRITHLAVCCRGKAGSHAAHGEAVPAARCSGCGAQGQAQQDAESSHAVAAHFVRVAVQTQGSCTTRHSRIVIWKPSECCQSADLASSQLSAAVMLCCWPHHVRRWLQQPLSRYWPAACPGWPA